MPRNAIPSPHAHLTSTAIFRLKKPLLVCAVATVVIVILAAIFRGPIGYHWYWGDCAFWEYLRYSESPDFPWWQWVLIWL